LSEISIRTGASGDGEIAFALLYELAEYEKLTDKFKLTREIIERDFLGPHAACHCDLVYLDDAPVGVMVWYRKYSSFAASRGIFLEDIFVKPEHRGKGIGKKLFAYLARRASEHGNGHIDWFVLDWNKPSIDFYENLGAELSRGWLSYSLRGEALRNLAGT
jgi:GNAT superfamily N-acetyltransferase